jgi:hypothetical protein
MDTCRKISDLLVDLNFLSFSVICRKILHEAFFLNFVLRGSGINIYILVFLFLNIEVKSLY